MALACRVAGGASAVVGRCARKGLGGGHGLRSKLFERGSRRWRRQWGKVAGEPSPVGASQAGGQRGRDRLGLRRAGAIAT